MDLSRLVAFDLETPKFRGGYRDPRIVCGSTAILVDGKIEGRLLSKTEVLGVFKDLLDAGYTLAVANGSYDLAVMAEHDRDLLAAIFAALKEGRIHDILIAESLHAIYGGHLGIDPRTGNDMRNPSTGKVTDRYSLSLCVDLNLNRSDAKDNDVFRESYALLEDFPVEEWPTEARQYPIDDARNQFEVAAVQLTGQPGVHAWTDLPPVPGVPVGGKICRYCNQLLGMPSLPPRCGGAPRIEPHKNWENIPAQTEAAFVAHLGACHSLRTDSVLVEGLVAEVDKKHEAAVKRFQKMGWIRDENSTTGEAGTEDVAAVKRSIVIAYGAKNPCPRCNGTGRVRNVTKVECRGTRGPTGRGRYVGCLSDACAVCGGTRLVDKIGNEVTCKNIFDESEVLQIAGCDGFGFDLSEIPVLPRTEKQGVSTDRDTKMESGDEELTDYGADEYEKVEEYLRPVFANWNPRTTLLQPECSRSDGTILVREQPSSPDAEERRGTPMRSRAGGMVRLPD